MNEPEFQTLIQACEKEPIHIPGAVQPFGALLAYSPYFDTLLQASANAATLIGCDDIWQTTLHQFLSGQRLQQIIEALQRGESFFGEDEHFALAAYVSGPYWVLELEPVNPHEDTLSVRSMLKHAYKEMRQARTPDSLLNALTAQLRQLSGFERVMVYQFDADWHGQVVAEAVGSRLPSMLDHHFPASDIPPQARAMYSVNPLRLIVSSTASAVPMQANPAQPGQEPVDMSCGTLRAVSPIHLQYLQNLGGGASCSVGIFDDDTLWGLITCHHNDPLQLHPKKREALKLLVDFASQRYFLLQSRAVQSYQQRIHAVRDAMIEESISASSAQTLFERHSKSWLELIQAGGCALIVNQNITVAGAALSAEDALNLADWLNSHSSKQRIFSTRSLRDCEGLTLSDDLQGIAGVVAIRLGSGTFSAWLLFFRPEHVEIRRWAGKPEKAVYTTIRGDMLGPRKSFSMWQQTVAGLSLPWQSEQIHAALDIGRDLMVAMDDCTA